MIDLDATQWHRQRLGRDRGGTVEQCLIDVGGLYGTAPTCYLSLAARVDSFRAVDLDRALYDERTLVRRRALRGSQFMIPVAMVDTVEAAPDRSRSSVEQWVLSIIDSTRLDELIAAVAAALAAGSRSVRELRDDLGVDGADAEALKYVVSVMEQRRIVCATTVTGGWRSNQFRYGLWEDWLPEHPPRSLDGDEARAAIALWYLGGHGPASEPDFRWWSGLTKRGALRALTDSGAVSVDTPLGSLYDLPDAEAPPDPEAGHAPGLRLLPVWDTGVVTQKERRRMVPESEYRRTYDPSGNATSMIVREGRVVGVWDRQGDDDHLIVKAAPFDTFDESMWESIEAEALVVGEALGVNSIELERHEAPIDLHDRFPAERNRFLSPLSG